MNFFSSKANRHMEFPGVRHALALAVLCAYWAEPAWADTLLINDGSSVVLPPDTTYISDTAGISAVVLDAGSSLSADGLTAIGTDQGSSGMVIRGESSATLTGATVSAGNDNVRGIWVDSKSTLVMSDSSVSSSGKGSSAILVETGSQASLDGMTLTTTGDSSAGLAVNDAPSPTYPDTSTEVVLRNSSITTEGSVSVGVSMLSNADPTFAVLSSVSITTSGYNSDGLLIQGASTWTPESTLATPKLVMEDTHVTTSGDHSQGLTVTRGADVMASDSSFTTTGTIGAYGVDVNSGGHVTLVDSTVSTAGDNTAGVRLIEGTGSSRSPAWFSMTGGSIHTTGAGASGISLSGGSEAYLTGVTVGTSGADAAAAQLSGGSLSVSGGSLSSAQGSAIEVLAPADGSAATNTITLSDGAQVTGGNGTFVSVQDETASVSLSLSNQVVAQGDITGVDSDGNGQISATTDMTLDQQSVWIGSTNGSVGQLSLSGGSVWGMTGDSTVGQLNLGDGTLYMGQPSEEAGSFETLTVTGDFSASGGTLVMGSELNDDASSSDMLHVMGDTSGQASIRVVNTGGSGAATADGIKLVEVDGASNAELSLSGRAVGGSYEYFLYQGSYTDPNDGDWYLRSTYEEPTDPVAPIAPVDPSAPVAPPPPPPPPTPTPVYRPEVGSYLNNQSAAVRMFQLSMHDRLGQIELDGRRLSDDSLGKLWLRVDRSEVDYDGIHEQFDSSSESTVVQLGADVARWGEQGNGRVGLMGGVGRNNNDVGSEITGYTSNGDVEGYSMGIYATWFADPVSATGLYLDGWLQHARYDNKVQGEGLEDENYGSRTLSSSLEAGYSWKIYGDESASVYIQPQVQLTYTDYDSDDHTEVNGTLVSEDESGGLSSRAGVQVYGDIPLGEGMQLQPFATGNWHHDSRDNAVAFDGEVHEGGVPRDRYEFKGGVQLQLQQSMSGWIQAGMETGEGDYRETSVEVGFKYAW